MRAQKTRKAKSSLVLMWKTFFPVDFPPHMRSSSCFMSCWPLQKKLWVRGASALTGMSGSHFITNIFLADGNPGRRRYYDCCVWMTSYSMIRGRVKGEERGRVHQMYLCAHKVNACVNKTKNVCHFSNCSSVADRPTKHLKNEWHSHQTQSQ